MENIFFDIKPAVGTPTTGQGYPAAKMNDGDNFWAHSVHGIFNHRTIPKENSNIHYVLSSRAKLCDMMSQAAISGSGFLVSKKFKSFLQNFNLGEHFFFDGSIEKKGQNHEYYWLHIIWNDRHTIVDFDKTNFYKKKYSEHLGELDISSNQDYWKVKEKIGSRFSIGFDHLVLKEYPNLDLWPVPYRGNLIVSSKLKTEIENNGFTGINISKNKILCFSKES